MNILKIVLIAPLAGLLVMPVYAHQYDHDGYSRFDKRVERQKSRIKSGIKNGELTRKEAGKLRKQQKRISALSREFRSDGYLSRKERKVLENKQDKASNKIYRLKHNDRHRDYYSKHRKFDADDHYSRYQKPSGSYNKHGWYKNSYDSYKKHDRHKRTDYSYDHEKYYDKEYFNVDRLNLLLRLSDYL